MSIKGLLKQVYFSLMQYSLYSACKEQKLLELRNQLAEIVPDLSQQYSSYEIESGYLVDKVRSQHAFQISLALAAVSRLEHEGSDVTTIVDIGDSSGNHLQYLKSLLKDNRFRPVAVNLDPLAIEKIESKGIEAIKSRAELLHQHPDFQVNVDVFLSYQMLEHLFDPVSFLHDMSTKSECRFFVITVPYVNKSRVGLDLVRYPERRQKANAETTHIFELSPDDWELVFQFSGWRLVESSKFRQYPNWSILTLLRFLWRKYDFDGFYGVILEKDDSFSKKYQSW